MSMLSDEKQYCRKKDPLRDESFLYTVDCIGKRQQKQSLPQSCAAMEMRQRVTFPSMYNVRAQKNTGLWVSPAL